MLPEPLDEASRLPWEGHSVIESVPDTFPGVSIVVPIYNAGRFLERTLRSLLFNDPKGNEIIVMDGGSTDNTGVILEHYKDHFKVCISDKDDGQSDAINKGFSLATKPILYWLNGDDLILPNALGRVRKVFDQIESVDVLVGNAYLTELDLTPIRHFEFTPQDLRFECLSDYAVNHLVQPSVFFTRAAWDECGPLSNELHYAMDADLFLGMSRKFEFIHLAADLAYSVYHEGCKTRNKRAESISELGLVQAKHGAFAEAHRTLNLVVEMYNSAAGQLQERRDGHSTTSSECDRCALLSRKVEAIEQEVERNKDLLLSKDLETP